MSGNGHKELPAGTSPFAGPAYKALISTLHAGDLVAYMQPQVAAISGGSHEPLSRQQLIERLRDCDALVSVIEDRIDDELLAAHPKLKVVANVAVGFDNVDVPAATKRGVLICNTPGVLDQTTADLGFALLLAVARRVVEADKFVREGKWMRWTSNLMLGTDLRGKTLGIIGLGRIGKEMALRAIACGMKIIYHQRHQATPLVEKGLQARLVPMEELLRESDVISIHCPLSKETRHLIGRDQFALMKPGCILINTARGAIVDEPALVQALQEGTLKGAGLDVFENEPSVPEELLKMDNVVLAPHMGSASVETRWAMATLAADGVLSALGGALPANAVNPEVWPHFYKRLTGRVLSG
ncbi:MAG TPA: D-glycerate dehydrogenase [Candidatus Obscuribacterales bacterium]